MALPGEKRGLYGQVESDAAKLNADAERMADAEAEGKVIGSHRNYVERMATCRLTQTLNAKAEADFARKGCLPVVMAARDGQRAALKGIARIAAEMQTPDDNGNAYGIEAVYAAINQSEGLAAHIDRTARCTQVAPDKPNYDGKARIRGTCALVNNAARNGLIDKYRGAKPIPSRKAPILPKSERDQSGADGEWSPGERFVSGNHTVEPKG